MRSAAGFALALLTAGHAAASEWASVGLRASEAVVRVQAESTPLHPALHALLLHHDLPAPTRLGQRPTPQTSSATRLSPETTLSTAHGLSGTSTATLWVDDQAVPATLGWVDLDLDLALLTHPPLPGPTLAFADDRVLGPGAAVLSVGHPLDGDVLVSAGVLAGRVERGLQGRSRRAYLVTDAIVRPGHSGGPLLNAEGQVIGLLVGGFGPSSGAEGFGLALPASTVSAALQRQGAPDDRRQIGAWLGWLDGAWRVTQVEVAGALRVGDAVRAVDGEAIGSLRQLADRISRAEPSQRWQVERDGALVEIEVPVRVSPRSDATQVQASADGLVVHTTGAAAWALGLAPGDRVAATTAEAWASASARGAWVVQVVDKGPVVLLPDTERR